MIDILIDLYIDKEPYIKKLTKDKIINLTGQSGSGKSYYAKQTFNSDEYLIVDTDDIFSEKRFINSNGIYVNFVLFINFLHIIVKQNKC